MLNLILNIIWLVLGGIELAIAWLLAGLIMAVSIIGLPWARSCFMLAGFSLWPFGREIADRRSITGREDLGTGPLGLLGNIIWFFIGGIWLFLGHLAAAVANFITIIGIPFGVQHFKLAFVSLAPIGKTVVDKN